MKVVTLVENKTCSTEYKNEHGLSFYIETNKHKILFDIGPKDSFLYNSKKLEINISEIDTVITSHGHKDHGGALKLFLENNKKGKIYIKKDGFDSFYGKFLFLKVNVGLDSSLANNNRIIFCQDICEIDDELTLFSGVSGKQFLVKGNDSLYRKTKDGFIKDDFSHEQNLLITEGNKKVLFGGCAHKGIVNILEKGKSIAKGSLDYVFSGFHLYNPITRQTEDNKLIEGIAQTLVKEPTVYYTCHCTGDKAYALLKKQM